MKLLSLWTSLAILTILAGANLSAASGTCYCRFVPERSDDFAFENDKVAYRFYGPALRDSTENNGTDAWLKRVDYPIIDKWYRQTFEEGKSYHKDWGEGHDPYHVGGSLGCGSHAIWQDGVLVQPNVFQDYRIIENGPDRVVFELLYVYEGTGIEDRKRITLETGSQLFRVDSTFTKGGQPVQLELAVGVVTHEGSAQAVADSRHKTIATWEGIDVSEVGTGVVLAPGYPAEFKLLNTGGKDGSHAVFITSTGEDGKVSYHAGYGWKKAGEITTFEQWQAYLREFSAGLAPVRASPNILLLLADDLGYGELGCYGQEVIQTPNIDRLASHGMRFTQFYAGSAVCAPSRAVLMTGKQVGRLNIRGNYGLVADQAWGRVALRKSNITVAEMLRDAGYQTAFIGKWHLDVPQDVSTWAAGRGFEYAVQEQWGEKPEGGKFDTREHWVNGREDSIFYDYTQYDCLDAFRTELALKFLEERRDADKPLFLFMSYRTPHAHEFDLRENSHYQEHGWLEIERRHAARITMLDEQVQRLLDKLEGMGELDNTLILFTSDNGPHGEKEHDPEHFASSGGLRGFKRDMYEGGLRVPLIAAWPGRIQPGTTCEQSAAFYDIMATFAEAAGIEPPADTDGLSLLPTLLGGESATHDHLYWEIQVGTEAENFRQGIRWGDWKGIRYGVGGAIELYNLESDIQETRNVADEHPEKVHVIEGKMRRDSHPVSFFPHAGGTKRTN